MTRSEEELRRVKSEKAGGLRKENDEMCMCMYVCALVIVVCKKDGLTDQPKFVSFLHELPC